VFVSLAVRSKKICAAEMERYSEVSTIHGIRYIGNENNNFFVRLSWIVALVLCMCSLCVYTDRNFLKWNEQPMGSTEKLRPIHELPFPTITICPNTKISKTKLDYDEIMKSFKAEQKKSLSVEDREKFEATTQTCDGFPNRNINSSDSLLPGQRIVEVINKTSFAIDSVFNYCIWKKKLFNCTDILRKVLTDKGYCFVFNMLNFDEIYNKNVIHDDFKRTSGSSSDNWDFESDYKMLSSNDYPRRISYDSQYYFAIFMITNKSDISVQCQGTNQGFSFYFHKPNEVRNREHSVHVDKNQDLSIMLSAESIKTSESLRHYTPEQRHCYFQDESPLKFFKSYTKTNCELECFANFTLKMCGCVKFSMPRINNTPICNFTKLNCMDAARAQWPGRDESYMRGMVPCKCLPSCRNIIYRIRSQSSGNLDTEKAFEEEVDKYPG